VLAAGALIEVMAGNGLAAAIRACDDPSELRVSAMVDQATGAGTRQNGG
jgi:hypothetical protein